MEDYDFAGGDAGSAGIEKVSAGSLKKGDLVMIKGRPCKVASMTTAKPGKHGSAKAIITAIDIFTSNKLETTFSTGDNVDAPVVKRVEYTLINIEEDGYVHLMDESGELKEDLKLPEDEAFKDVAERCKEIFNEGKKECIVVVISALGQEKMISAREGKDM